MGVQKNREVAAHWLVPGVQHGLRAAANHNPVTVLHRQAHQGIAHCATDQVGLHGQIMGPARAKPQASGVALAAQIVFHAAEHRLHGIGANAQGNRCGKHVDD